jgi:hypothetical protein
MSIPPPLLLLSQHNKGFPRLASPILSPPLSPLLRLSGKNSTGTIHQITSSTCSCIVHPPPPGPSRYAINRTSESSSPSASIVFALHRCHHPSSPPLSVAGSTRVISIKDTASGVQYSSFILFGNFGLHPAGPWTYLESFAAYAV